MKFEPDNTAVIVVDMQNGFAHPDGTLYSEPSEEVIPTINQTIEQARQAGAEVIFTQDVHTEDQFDDTHYYDEFDRWGEHVLEGTWDAELHENLDVTDGDYIVQKPTYDAFHETGLDDYLTKQGITDLVIVGTLANVCVLHTASSAALRDYKPVIAKDAVGYLTEDHKKYALDHAEWLFGELGNTAEIVFE